MTVLVDTHCHLDSRRFAQGAASVLQRAHAAGVAAVIDVGVGGDQRTREAVELARKRSDVVAAVGIDPHEAAHCSDERWSLVESLASVPEVAAIGETGLDYFYNDSPIHVQRSAFVRQVELAIRVGKPLIIHTREAGRDTIDVLRAERASAVGGVFHCFTGDIALARCALDLGFVLSFSGILTFDAGPQLSEVARFVPENSVVVETDSPYLSPVPVRKHRPCEPAFVVHTARYLAVLRGVAFEDLCNATTVNAYRVFHLDVKAAGIPRADCGRLNVAAKDWYG
jgi:TatD DNase family protein